MPSDGPRMRVMIKRAVSFFLAVFLASAFIFMVTIKPAHAYIEAGSLSFAIQILVASFFGALFMLKVYWSNVTGKLSRFVAKIRSTKANTE